MKGIKNPQTNFLQFILRWSRSFFYQQDGISLDLGYFIFITDFLDDRINQNIDDMCAMFEFCAGDKLGKSADIRNQYRC